MPRTRQTRLSKRNLFGFGKKSAPARKCASRSNLTIPQAMDAAYSAGYKTPDTGHFTEWACSVGLNTRGATLLRRLRAEYNRGFEDKMRGAQGIQATTHRTGAPTVTSRSTTTKASAYRPLTYKGYTISPTGDGDFTTNLEPGSRFDSESDARRFIDSWRKNPMYRSGLVTKFRNPSELPGTPKGYDWELVMVLWPRDTSRVATTHNFQVDSYDAGVRLAKRLAGDSQTYSHVTNRAFDFGIYHKGELRGGADWEFKGNAQNIRFRRYGSAKRNPQDTSDAMYESFHGRAPDEVVEIETPVHEHTHLAALGTLVSLKVATESGYDVEIEFEEDPPLLCSNETGTQLYFEGGSQELDLRQLHLEGEKWERDLMVVGELTETTYRTQKAFDKFQTIDYYHANGEETGVVPLLLYDPVSQLMSVAGGQYRVKPEGIVN